jgi:hypothetical protein
MCLDDPFVFLLWPQDCTWSQWSPTEYLLPLRARLTETLFHMLYEAHRFLWPMRVAGVPPLSDLMPEFKVFRRLPL